MSEMPKDQLAGKELQPTRKASLPQEFFKRYDARANQDDWDVLEEANWSIYSRLETFRRLIAWSRGEGWRGYDQILGAPIMYDGCTKETIDMVVNSPDVQRTIQSIAQVRATTLLSYVRDGKIPREYVRAYLDGKKVAETPSVDTDRLSPAVPVSHFLDGPVDRNVSILQQFYTSMRTRIGSELLNRTREIVEDSAARMDSRSFARMFGASVNEILASMYNYGAHVRMSQVLELRRIATEAAKKKQSVIFLPCHKSHIDYLVLSWILYRVGLSLPHIIAGDNLDIPVVGSVLRRGGAMFIRRSFQGDSLYPMVIKEYIMSLLSQGKNLEVFIEGTRSRTGKLLPPKYGILKYLMTAIRENRTSDILLCPVSLQYDSVIEAETYVSELLGKPKQSESLYGLITGGSALLQLKMGRIDVRFQRPWSMREFLHREEKQRVVKPNEDRDSQLLKSLGYRVLSDINHISVIMPAAMVGTVLLTMRGRGIGRSALIAGVTRLREQILHKGYEVANFGLKSISEIVDRALSLMKGLVAEHNNLLEVTFEPVKVFELSFYRNQIMHIFVHEALICAAIYTRVKQGGPFPMQRIGYNELYESVSFISWVLRDEFVFDTNPLETNIEKTVLQMLHDHVLAVSFTDDSNAIATMTDLREGRAMLGIAEQERYKGRDSFDTYLFLIWPYVESYWLASVSLLALAPQAREFRLSNLDQQKPTPDIDYPRSAPNVHRVPWYLYKDLLPSTQKIGLTLYRQGELSYYESVNSATLTNAFARLEEMGIILSRMTEDKKPTKLIAVSPLWVPHVEVTHGVAPTEETAVVPGLPPNHVFVGQLISYLNHLVHFRREGKDRRNRSDNSKIFEHIFNGGPSIVVWETIDVNRIQGEYVPRL
ncbi:hypothetical protein MYAM1_001222 [Malassezia yamatoensis]|uniref:Phospholipid/glycerol acyltransferase domain-containing protein n=1 Tax=Malassezia yamatoensis TaxID=253288 RepID=A0AAJ5YQ92_9BASI|nr:hypothetical protein MYAM1_001222 [Malassezia yamatoensis]